MLVLPACLGGAELPATSLGGAEWMVAACLGRAELPAIRLERLGGAEIPVERSGGGEVRLGGSGAAVASSSLASGTLVTISGPSLSRLRFGGGLVASSLHSRASTSSI